MRGLMAAVIGMGVLIVLGIGVVATTIVRRMNGPATAQEAILSEPPGTRIAGIAGAGNRLALLLQGGGQDRVILFDPATGHAAPLATLSAAAP